jgi:hypothetical protein
MKARLWVEELESRVVLSSPPSLLHQVATATISTVSTNWSGYAALPQSGSVTAVSASWVVPAVTGASTAYSSFWVGIDGYSSNTVEQIGTDSDIQIENGKPVAVYYAWFEMYPNPSFDEPLKLSGKTIAISPKDTINASVTYTAATSTYALNLTDVTTGASFSIAQKLVGAQNSSAEWIAEAPSSNSGVLPLANFGTVSFSSALATIGGNQGSIDSPTWQNASINMVAGRNNSVIAATSGLTDTAAPPTPTSSFTVAYSAPTSTPTPPPARHRGGRTPNAAFLQDVGASDPMAGANAAAMLDFASAGPSGANGGVAGPQAATTFQQAANRLDAPALSPVLSALTLNGPRADSASDPAIDNAEPISIWLPAGVNSARTGAPGSFAEIVTTERSQPAIVTDGAPMQVVLGAQAGDPFAAPLPEPTPTPTPEQHGGNADNLVARTFSKALWLVGTVAFATHGAFVGKTRQNDPRDEAIEKKK